MKKYLSILFAVQLLFVCAQVGVNTEDPQTTLDVVASPDDASLADGITAPRVTGQQLKAKDGLYETPETGAIVFVTEALVYDDPEVEEDPAIDAAVATTTKTQLVTSVGYYYFDGTIWRPFHKEPWNVIGTDEEATNVNENIYHLGKTTVGSKNFDNAAFNIFMNTDVNPASFGQQMFLLDKHNSIANGFNMLLIPSSTPDTAEDGNTDEITAMSIGIQDRSTVKRSPSVAKFSYIGDKAVDKPGTTVEAVSSSISLGSNEEGDYNIGNMEGMSSSIDLGSFGTGNVNITEDVVGFKSSITSTAKGTANLGINGTGVPGIVVAGEFENKLSAGTNGTVNAVKMYGLTSLLNFVINNQSIGATVDVTDAAALNVLNQFNINDASATYNIDNLYGLRIQNKLTSVQGNISMGSTYGLFIEDFRVINGGTVIGNDYNFYSQGNATRNVFEGKVGVGTTEPGDARMHIIKDASDITPVIIEGLPVYADDAAASSLPSGALYKSSDGILRVKN